MHEHTLKSLRGKSGKPIENQTDNFNESELDDHDEFKICYFRFPDHCPLGMENYFIKDSQLTASSQNSLNYRPARARLNIFADGAGYGAWIPANSKQFYQTIISYAICIL